MKVVIISGSPRKDANTEVMMKHVFEYTKQQNKINYYILFSIIAQILGILFILFLFKTILNNKIKPNA